MYPEFQKKISEFETFIGNYNRSDIAENSLLYRLIREWIKKNQENFKQGKFLDSGIKISLQYFNEKFQELINEVKQRETVSSTARKTLKQKLSHYLENKECIKQDDLNSFAKFAKQTMEYISSGEIYSAFITFEKVKDIGKRIERDIVCNRGVIIKLSNLFERDRTKAFAADLSLAENWIKDKNFKKADEILNTTAQKIANKAELAELELEEYQELYGKLRKLYFKNLLNSDTSELTKSIKSLRDSIRERDFPAMQDLKSRIFHSIIPVEITNYQNNSEIEDEYIDLIGKSNSFSTIVLQSGNEKINEVSDKDGFFCFGNIGLAPGGNLFEFYNEDFFPITNEKLTITLSRKDIFWGLTDILTGRELNEFKEEDIVLCKGCKTFSYIQSFTDYGKCPACGYGDFWRYGEYRTGDKDG